MLLDKTDDKIERNKERGQRNQHFPGAGIVPGVGRFVLTVGVDLGCNKNHHEEDDEGNLSRREFHVDNKGNVAESIPYFYQSERTEVFLQYLPTLKGGSGRNFQNSRIGFHE
jgi:hypothetical protein